MPGFLGSLFGTAWMELLQYSRRERRASNILAIQPFTISVLLDLLQLYDPVPTAPDVDLVYSGLAADVWQRIDDGELNSSTAIRAVLEDRLSRAARGEAVDQRSIELLAKRINREVVRSRSASSRRPG
jgi:hypothetical protein